MAIDRPIKIIKTLSLPSTLSWKQMAIVVYLSGLE
jgi:hypothetical protein